MTEYLIDEFDRDYRVVTRSFYMSFSSEDEANKWCLNNSWTGCYYFIRKI
jgi:hypothetical protein